MHFEIAIALEYLIILFFPWITFIYGEAERQPNGEFPCVTHFSYTYHAWLGKARDRAQRKGHNPDLLVSGRNPIIWFIPHCLLECKLIFFRMELTSRAKTWTQGFQYGMPASLSASWTGGQSTSASDFSFTVTEKVSGVYDNAHIHTHTHMLSVPTYH